ncbi:MAG TPA: GatB/YqeY domain-containing protein [Candidatus Paceibacterota bacterium]
MTLKQTISDDLKSALKASEAIRLSTLRMLSAAIANKEIELRKKDIGLSDGEVLDVVSSEARRRKDSITEYDKAQRIELAQKERDELTILQSYLPPEIADDELVRIIRDGIREAGATSEKDFGKVMKVIMPILKGKASGDRIAAVLKKELGQKGA